MVTYQGFDAANNPEAHHAIQVLTPPVSPVTHADALTPLRKFMESIPEVEMSDLDALLKNIHLILLMDKDISTDQEKWLPHLKDRINQCNGNMNQFVKEIEAKANLLAVVQAEGDLNYLGLDAAQAAQLWAAIQAEGAAAMRAEPEPAPGPLDTPIVELIAADGESGELLRRSAT